ncbi:MAG: protein kinase [bacterium]|nr:protein kinase [bacterium]
MRRWQPRDHTNASTSAEARAAQIVEVVQDVAHRLRQGDDVDPAQIEAEHPELMPELRERLQTLEAIEAAAQRADLADKSGDDGTFDLNADPEELAVLTEALTGYDILERLSGGGQGVVYRACQQSTRRAVALKVLREGPLATTGKRRRFEREVEIISRLRHPNIVTLYDSGVVRGRYFYAMEFVEGLSLDDYLLLHGPDLQERIRLIQLICAAVGYAHQNGVIHRDLKPSNILVDLDGQPHVLDFGLAKDLASGLGPGGKGDLSIAGEVVGTLPYLSPEQVRNGSAVADVRSDIYALGVVLYRILTGTFPYPLFGSTAATWNNILHKEPVPLRQADVPANGDGVDRPAGITDDLEAIVAKTLEKDAAARYQTVAALQDDLERFLSGEAVAAMVGRRLYAARKTFRRYRIHIGIAAVFALLLLASTISVTVMWTQARAERDNAREVARVAHGTLHDVVTSVEDSLQPLAGGTAVRDQILDQVDARLNRQRPLVASDAGLDDVWAALNEKQGDIAYLQDRHDDAQRHHRTFLEASLRALDLADPTDAQAWHPVARAHRKLGLVADDAEAELLAAIEIGERLAAAAPDDEQAQLDLCEARIQAARYYTLKGQAQRAVEHIDSAINLAEPRTALADIPVRWRALLAKAEEWNGDIREKLGQLQMSEAALKRSNQLREDLLRERPGDVNLRQGLAATLARLGTLQATGTRPDEAITTLRAALSITEEIVALEPTVIRWKRDLYATHHRLAHFLLQQGDLGSARLHCDKAVAIANQLLAEDTTNPHSFRVVAFSHNLRGRLRLAEGEIAAAVADLEESVAAFSKLVESDPSDVSYRTHLAFAHDKLGGAYCRRNQWVAARREYEAAKEIRSILLSERPTAAERATLYILSLSKFGDWHRLQNSPEHDRQALRFYSEADERLTELFETGRLVGQEPKYNGWLTEFRAYIDDIGVRREGNASPGT